MTVESALAASGLQPLSEILDRLAAGDDFPPIVSIETKGDRTMLVRTLRRCARERSVQSLTVCAAGDAFLGTFPEEELTEKFLGLAANGGAAATRMRRTLARSHGISPFESDRALLLCRTERIGRYELLVEFMTEQSRDRPVLVLVEEGERVEGPLLELLLYLGRSIGARQRHLSTWPRVVFVVLGGADGMTRESFVTRLKQRPLTTRQTRRSLRQRFPGKRIPASLVTSVLETSQGDPCLAAELIDRLNADALDGTAQAVLGSVPATRSWLQAALHADAGRLILASLAVCPRPLPVRQLREVTGLGRRTFARRLNDFVQAELLLTAGGTVELASSRLRDAVLTHLSEETKKDIAARLARSFAACNGSDILYAYHLFASGQKETALQEVLAAVNRLRAEGTLDRAQAILATVVERYGDDIPDQELVLLRHDCAEVCTLRGDHVKAQMLLRQNWRYYTETGDRRAAARTQVHLGLLAANLDKRDEALRELEEAAEVLAGEPQEAEEYLRLQLALSRVSLEKAEYDRALGIAQKAAGFLKRHYRPTPSWQRLKGVTYSRMGNIHAALSDFSQAEAAYEASLAAFEAFPDSVERGGLFCNLARLSMTRSDYRTAQRHYREAARLARATGARELLGLIETNLGVLGLYLWDLDEAEKHIRAGIGLTEELGSSRFGKFARLCLGNLRGRQGRHEEALQIFSAEKKRARQSDDRHFLMNVCLQSVYPLMERGEWQKARTAAATGARLAAELAWPHGILEGELTQGQIAAALGRWDAAAEHLRRGRESPWGHHRHIDAEFDHLEGQIHAARGDPAAAIEAYRRAAASFRSMKVWVYAMKSRLGHAEVLLMQGRRAEAKRLVNRTHHALSKRPVEKRPSLVWMPLVTLRAEIFLSEAGHDKANRRACFYELAEALARAREVHAAPYLWHLLSLLGRCCRELRDPNRARRYLHEATNALHEYLRLIPAECRSYIQGLPAAEGLTPSDGRAAGSETGPPAILTTKESRTGEAAFHGLVGRSPALGTIISLIRRVGPTDLPVLISGESGTGKELVAHAVHRSSGRARGPFEADSCAAIPEKLAEAEFFGCVPGAFTGADHTRTGRIEAASGGTLFLDEVGDLPLPLQAKLLRVLTEGAVRPLGSMEKRPVNVRLVTATNRDLRAEIGRGSFRQDLFYRLLGVEIRLPPLRERGDDILLLAEHFLRSYLPPGKTMPRLTARAREALLRHAWPGNVRELENEMRRLAVFGQKRIDKGDLRITAEAPPHEAILVPGVVRRHSLAETHTLVEKEYLRQALEECGGVIARVAHLLGVNRRTVYRMMRRAGIRSP